MRPLDADDPTLVVVVSFDGPVLWPPSPELVRGPQRMGELHEYQAVQDETVRVLRQAVTVPE